MDVGCAQATLALQLAEAGHRVWAVDLRQEFLDYAASRYEHGEIEFVQGNVLELSIAQRFNLIFANQIVEHLVYPLEMLEVLKKLLKPGGRLVVTIPNWHYLMNNFPSFTELGDPQAWESRQFSADGDGHFFAYQEVELRQMFSRAGLEDVAIQFFESPWICGHMKLRYLHDKVSVEVLRKLDNMERTSIGAHVLLAPGCFITDHNHGIALEKRIDQQDCICSPVLIDDDVWVGAHAIILPGVNIGKGAVIGAGAVVTQNVDAFSVVGGVPARMLSKRV